MPHDKISQLQQGFTTAFLNSSYPSNLAYKPEFLSNNYKEGRKVLSSIEEELLSCEEFSISVAFVTMSGITPLLQTLKELEQHHVKGRILTTDYLNFSEPKALDKLAELKNISLKMYCVDEASEGFHTKGYIFRKEEIYRIIIGSSNMTLSALTTNKEWNAKIVSTDQGEYARDVLAEFEELWGSQEAFDYEDFIEKYQIKYELIKKQRQAVKNTLVPSVEAYRLQPNSMQIEFIQNINKLLLKGEKRGLLISATGTGKTYASAFAMREMAPKKALFVVHREQIAKQAMRSYRRVFGDKKKDGSLIRYGLISGNSREFEADIIFSTMQMMAKKETLQRFQPDEFDMIVLDEAHRTGAESYQRIIDYFRPRFLLGMTASPERSDDFDIYRLFDHNIAYEIRLQKALEENLLCPFHYFGITELEIDGEVIGDEQNNFSDFRRLTSDIRVEYVIAQAKYYGYSGDRVKGLIFCSRKTEAVELSRKFNEHGYKTVFLSGDVSQEERERCIDLLTKDVNQKDSQEEYLDYIFTVDIFNEGVDIPEINQVIMLRPTESPIIFVQQLGRGLRKADGKEYVIILDFIGNYTNNFMIPIALSGDRTYNKDNVRKYVREGVRIIPGASTIHFDEISKKRIFNSIDTANFNDIRIIKENYKNLKNKLGHIPSLLDFDRYGEMDVCRIFDNNSLGSYYKFLVKYEKEYTIRLSLKEEKVIEFISRKLASGKRIHEMELLNRMLEYRHGLMKALKSSLQDKYGVSLEEKARKSVINVMTNEFPSGAGKKTYAECVFLQKEDKKEDYAVSETFEAMLKNPDFYCILKELVEFGISRYRANYSERYQDTNLVLYQKYTYEDACRLLNWENNEVPLNIGGYKFDRMTRTLPVFINYDKAEDISDTTRYEDHFVDSNTLIAISKSGRFMQSEDVQNFLHAAERGIAVHLFVRKNKDDKISKEFYYLGRMLASGKAEEFVMGNTEKTAVEIEWKLETPVREDLYEYFTR